MIQDQLGGAGLLDGERKVSFSGGVLKGLPSSSSPSLSSSTTTTTTITSSENLRCPRCDSSNTKFCYYNNYNLTQPRHFCKTCRRYWTKGGALRNIPMGGGCRKNKHTTTSTTVGKLTHAKVKSSSFHIVKSNLGSGFDQETPTNTILWGWPQTSQLLAFLRGTQNPNLNPKSISNSVTIKDEGATIGVTGAQNAGTLTLDPLGQGPIGLCSSFGGNNQQQEQQQCLLLDEVQTTGIQELYQRLRSSENYFTDHSPPLLSSVPSMSSSSSSILEQVSIAGGELGCWNSSFSWSNLPATNGAFS